MEQKSKVYLHVGFFKFVVWFDFRAIYVCILGFCANCIGYCSYHCFLRIHTYFLFAVPVQLWLRKKPKNFSLVHLFIYTAVAFFAVFLFWHIDNPPIDFAVFRSFIYYIMSIAAAFIYWFWDSIFLRNYNVHRK